MTDLQQAKLRTFKSVLGVFSNHTGAYTKIPALVKAHGALTTLVDKLDPTAAGQQNPDTEPVSAVKKKTKRKLALQANDLAALLHALADETDNTALLTESDYTESILSRKSDVDLLRIGQRMHLLGTDYATALVEQGLEADELANLAATIAQYKAEMGTPRTAIAEGTAANKERKGFFRDGMNLLRNRLDKQMSRFKTRDRKFYDAYKSARQVINTAARSEPPAPPTA